MNHCQVGTTATSPSGDRYDLGPIEGDQRHAVDARCAHGDGETVDLTPVRRWATERSAYLDEAERLVEHDVSHGKVGPAPA